MTDSEKLALQRMACRVRMSILEAVHSAGCGHPGGSLSAADLLTYLYFREMHIDPRNPQWTDRDRFVLSKGHITPGLYAALAHRGFFPLEELRSFRQLDSRLQGHPNMHTVPGVDVSTGSLGQGLSLAAGIALGLKHRNQQSRVYALLGDGEIQEGQCWEALMFAAHYHLDNLVAIVDNNGLQSAGPVERVMNPYPIAQKLQAFGLHTLVVDGHDFDALEAALNAARETRDKPTAIVMNTIKGKGVSFMENQVGWHGKAPNDEEFRLAMAQLQAQLKQLEA